MNVLALVSGGKDSCYSILQCQKHGHKVVALGNLLPPDSIVDELDSYMYQTVGHQLVSAYATCTGLPLYRRRIQGHSRSQELSYSATAGDEVEDLFLLLAYVKELHPEVQAVASGAIASDYQRLRVESVCARLGLVSLGYLWHQPQEQLLADMIANDIEAVLVKVAALGLDPHKHLGKSIRQLQPHLHRLRDRFGCNVCGEGGEYETLTLDCPAFTRGRIVLDSWEVVLHSPDSIAAVGVLHPTGFHIEPKGDTTAYDDGSCSTAPEHQVVIEVPLHWQPQQPQPAAAAAADAVAPPASTQQWETKIQASVSQQHVHVMCSAHAPGSRAGPAAGAASSPAAEPAALSAQDTAAALEAALLAVSAQLAALQGITSWQHSCFVHLYLADMSHFAVANAAYCKHLPQVNPPSRACVQVPLPAGCPVLLDVLFARQPGPGISTPAGAAAADQQLLHSGGRDDQSQQPQPQPQQQQQQQQQPDRRVLHVQSISDWAPSCIGPYSQATSCNGIIHMAGQIPLDPGSMNIVTSSTPAAPPGATQSNTTSSSGSSSHMAWAVAAQVWRTLCSCQAVAVAVKSCFASSCLGLTVYLTPAAAAAGGQQLVQAALQAVRQDRSLLTQPGSMPAALIAAAAAAAGVEVPAAEAGGAFGNGQGCAAAGAGDCSGSEASEEGGQEEPYLDDYLRPPEVQQAQEPAVVYLTVPELPRGALLEVQPLLIDLAAAAGAPSDSSSSSSSSSDDEGHDARHDQGVPSSDSAAVPELLQQGVLEQQGIAVEVSRPSHSSWCRVLLQLQHAGSSSVQGVKGHAQQAAAAGRWLVAYCSQGGRQTLAGGQPGQHAAQVASLRCWYDATLQEGTHRGGCWTDALLAGLPSEVAGQVVPVLRADCAGGSLGSCWCLVEVLLLLT